MKPEGYPLPWCDTFDVPYWQLNMILIRQIEGWQEYQSKKLMNDIIPVIRWILEK